jgi:hypothetical protein
VGLTAHADGEMVLIHEANHALDVTDGAGSKDDPRATMHDVTEVIGRFIQHGGIEGVKEEPRLPGRGCEGFPEHPDFLLQVLAPARHPLVERVRHGVEASRRRHVLSQLFEIARRDDGYDKRPRLQHPGEHDLIHCPAHIRRDRVEHEPTLLVLSRTTSERAGAAALSASTARSAWRATVRACALHV